MRKTLLTLILALILVSGCSHLHPSIAGRIQGPPTNGFRACSTPDLVIIPPHSDNRFEDAVRVAVEYWNRISPRKLFIFAGRADVPAGLLRPRGFVYVRFASAPEVDDWNNGTMGKFLRTMSGGCIAGGSVLIRPLDLATQGVLLDNITRHELGHAIGLEHQEWGEHLMSWRWPKDASRMKKLELSEKALKTMRKVYKERGSL